MQNVLEQLGLAPVNPGAFSGEWRAGGETVEHVSPADGKPLASVQYADSQDYETTVERAHQAFLKWRKVPAPVRGETIRRFGNALREVKAKLATLVSLE